MESHRGEPLWLSLNGWVWLTKDQGEAHVL